MVLVKSTCMYMYGESCCFFAKACTYLCIINTLGENLQVLISPTEASSKKFVLVYSANLQ